METRCTVYDGIHKIPYKFGIDKSDPTGQSAQPSIYTYNIFPGHIVFDNYKPQQILYALLVASYKNKPNMLKIITI